MKKPRLVNALAIIASVALVDCFESFISGLLASFLLGIVVAHVLDREYNRGVKEGLKKS